MGSVRDGDIVHVVGARPQFVKAAAVLAAVTHDRHRLVHTGQHYDAALSDVFFAELGIPAPDHHLGVGSGTHGVQTGAMLGAIDAVLLGRRPGAVVVYGDTNSTVAGALSAAKLCWPVAHVEAGLRSYDRTMPEEINRVVTDHLSARLLCPTQIAVEQLAREGLTEGVVVTGDVMLDIAQRQAARAMAETAVGRFLSDGARGAPPPPLDALADATQPYALATLHRASNTDHADTLRGLVGALGALGLPVVWPVHPRTRKAMASAGIEPPPALHCVPPAGYLDFAALLRGASLVLTDSGGVQKEACFAGVRCVTLRDRTEWPETLQGGWNVLTGASPAAVVEAARRPPPTSPPPTALFGDGQAARRTAEAIEALAG